VDHEEQVRPGGVCVHLRGSHLAVAQAHGYDLGQEAQFPQQDIGAQQLYGMHFAMNEHQLGAYDSSCLNDSWHYYAPEACQPTHFAYVDVSQVPEFAPYMNVPQVAFEHNVHTNIASDEPFKYDLSKYGDFSDSEWESNVGDALRSKRDDFSDSDDDEQETPLPIEACHSPTSKHQLEKFRLGNCDWKSGKEACSPLLKKPAQKDLRRDGDWEAPTRVVRSLNALDLDLKAFATRR